ncbi:hypothetical protein ACODNH_20965 (plasmid) [Haloarcula sp. NS06]|uniref:hypothetical protein n=1 Tax=Haloarcula sp. NS06 TaxID=3409688 RepID=UPI003DA77A9D
MIGPIIEVIVKVAFEVVFEIIIEPIASVIWRFLLVVIGIVTAAIGITVINESPKAGGALIIVGTVLLGGSLVSLYR